MRECLNIPKFFFPVVIYFKKDEKTSLYICAAPYCYDFKNVFSPLSVVSMSVLSFVTTVINVTGESSLESKFKGRSF